MKTEIIVAGAIGDVISDDVKRFHVANTARDYFSYNRGFFSVYFLVIAAWNERHTEEVKDT
ncbi:MAG: hypothetical protein WAN55_11015 [Halobacteriota archaeon]